MFCSIREDYINWQQLLYPPKIWRFDTYKVEQYNSDKYMKGLTSQQPDNPAL